MDRLRRDHSRELVGAVLVVVALVALVIGYANIKDEAEVAIQLPYILTGGIGALVLTAVVESIGYDLRERVVYLNQLLEAGLLPDESADAAKK